MESAGDRVCRACGLVEGPVYTSGLYQIAKDTISNSSARQFVSLGKKIDSVDGLGSYIDRKDTYFFHDHNNRPICPDMQAQFRRLKKVYDFKVRIKHKETTYRIFNSLNTICGGLELPKEIQEYAAYLYRKIKKNEDEIKNHVCLIAFCLFIAIRKNNRNAPVNIQEIANTFQDYGHRVTPRLILRNGMLYKKYIQSEVRPHVSEDYFSRLIDGVGKMENIESRLRKKGFKCSVEDYVVQLRKALQFLAKKFTMKHRRGRNPFILAGAMIYAADKILAKRLNKSPVLTQKLASIATGIAEYSIRDHYIAAIKPFMKNTTQLAEI